MDVAGRYEISRYPLDQRPDPELWRRKHPYTDAGEYQRQHCYGWPTGWPDPTELDGGDAALYGQLYAKVLAEASWDRNPKATNWAADVWRKAGTQGVVSLLRAGGEHRRARAVETALLVDELAWAAKAAGAERTCELLLACTLDEQGLDEQDTWVADLLARLGELVARLERDDDAAGTVARLLHEYKRAGVHPRPGRRDDVGEELDALSELILLLF